MRAAVQFAECRFLPTLKSWMHAGLPAENFWLVLSTQSRVCVFVTACVCVLVTVCVCVCEREIEGELHGGMPEARNPAN